MSTILSFPKFEKAMNAKPKRVTRNMAKKQSETQTQLEQKSAQIIIFSGVRIERIDANNKDSQYKGAKSTPHLKEKHL